MSDSKDTATLEITVRSDPFMDDPKNADEFYTAVGKIMMLWGRFESNLESTLRAIVNLPEGKPYRPAKGQSMPFSFTGKKVLWKKVFNGLPRLKRHRETAQKLIADAIDASKDRATIVHSHWNGFVAEDPLTVQALHHRYRGGKIVQAKYNITLPQLEDCIKTIDRLNTRLLPIEFHVISLYPRPKVGGNSRTLDRHR